MKVIFTRNTIAKKEPVQVGEIRDLDPKEARLLILLGKAKPYSPPADPAAPATEATTEQIAQTAEQLRQTLTTKTAAEVVAKVNGDSKIDAKKAGKDS
jgi:hypothetical protein